jgi:N-acetylmuramoyl-L-alanine amidase
MIIIDALLTPNEYSRRQKANTPKKIVVHYVGNPGSSAMANRNYFEGLKVGKLQKNGKYRFASSHYIIDLDGKIIRCIPENEEAIHASDNAINASSIGIENCHPDWSGEFTNATTLSLIELCADICKRYNINPLTDIIRHYDVPKANKKDCPRWFVTYPEEFTKLKEGVKKKIMSPEQLKQQRIEETISGLINMKRKDDVTCVTDNPESWRKALNGDVPINPNNLTILLRRMLKLE